MERWLAMDTQPLVITGPPGVGKSALASRLSQRTDRTALRADLSLARTRADVLAEVAKALGVPPRAAYVRSARALALAFGAAGPCLMVLDGAEAISDDMVTVLLDALPSGPEHAVLLTSRRRLDADSLELAPLAVPDDSADREAPAFLLWCACVRRARGPYAPQGEELEAAVRVLRRLDGLPLAVELAAARAARIGAAAVERGLEAKLALVSPAPLGEQRCVQTTVLDAMEPLLPSDRKVVAMLSVFRGAFDARAAAAVLDVALTEVREALGRLRRASLLVATDEAADEDTPRVRLLRLVGEVAVDAFGDRHDLEAASQRHSAYFAGLAMDSIDVCVTSHRDDLRAVLDRALLPDAPPTILVDAVRIAVALERAPWAWGAWLMERLLPLSERAADAARAGALPEELLAGLQQALAHLQLLDGPLPEALSRCAQAQRVFAARSDHGSLARCGRIEARALFEIGRPAEAEAAAQRALRHAVASGESLAQGQCVHTVASLRWRRHHDDSVQELLVRAVAHYREAGDDRYRGSALYDLAGVALDRGELERAEEWIEEALSIAARDPLLCGVLEGARGQLHHDRGLLEEALEAYERARALAQQHGAAHFGGLVGGNRGIALLELGYVDASRGALEAAADTMRALGSPNQARLFEAFALLARARQGEDDAPLISLLRAPRTGDGWLDGPLAALAEGLGVDGEVAKPAARGVEARIAARVARAGTAATPPDRPGLVVAADWFWTPAGGRVDTRRRAPMRRILAALARSPGRTHEADELVALGWPGEQILPKAATNRLHVTLHRLRKLGVGDALVFDDDGWTLDPHLETRLEERA